MADDAHEERFRQHEEILRGLTAMLAAQHEKNQSYDAIIQEQREMNRHFAELHRQQAEINQDIQTTLARVETLLARMIRHEDNGRDA
jgi:uncharacterized protein YhaN